MIRLGLLFISSCLLAADPALVYKQFRQRFPSKECHGRLNELNEFKILFANDAFQAFVIDAKKVKPLAKALEGWSTDLLIKLVFEIEQEIEPICGRDKSLGAFALEMKRLCLRRVGVDPAKLSVTETERLFRGTIALKDDREKIRKKIEDYKKVGVGARHLLATLYGSSHEIGGVVVVAPSDFPIKKLKARIEEICGKKLECEYWNRRAIYKAIIVPEPGLAGYVPEVGTLLVSQDLLTDDSVLHRIVFFHELVHVAEKSVWLEKRVDWKAEFATFSGWREAEDGSWKAEAKTVAGERKDKLTELSQTSPYSILPDPVVLGENGKDGFVLGKSYLESMKNGPSEDLADHLAITRYLPERYTYQGKSLAPEKLKWCQRILKK